MIVKNLTRNTIITKDLKIAASFSDRLFGLLNKKNPRSLLLITRFGIHTFGLNGSIDVLIVGKDNCVKKTKTLPQNRLYFYKPTYQKVIELPQNTIKNSKTKNGDIIKISD